MTNDELRALADALTWVQYTADWQACHSAADYLRACADAQPVAWLYRDAPWFDGVHWHDQDDCTIDVRVAKFKDKSARPLYTHPAPVAPHHAMLDSHRRLVEQAIQSAEHPSGMSTHDGKARIDASVLRRMLAIIDSLPAVPQAEPCIGNDPTCPCQDGDACHYRDAADGTKGWPVPQAEPKREPLTYEQLVSACYTYRHDFGLLDPDEQHLVIEEAGRWAKAFGIGGSNAE